MKSNFFKKSDVGKLINYVKQLINCNTNDFFLFRQPHNIEVWKCEKQGVRLGSKMGTNTTHFAFKTDIPDYKS